MQQTECLFIGKNLINLHSTNSTNSYAKGILSKTTPPLDGTVIMTDTQIAGRGYANNVWESESGKNVALSIILKPHFIAPKNQFWLNMAVSLGVADALESILNEPIKVKWPNDIIHNHKKIGGILIENSFQANNWQYAVVGIGININQTVFSTKAGSVTSMQLIANKTFDLAEVTNKICSSVEAYYLQLRAGKINHVREAYMNKLYLLDVQANYSDKNGTFTGTIIGIDDVGQLIINKLEGEAKYQFKEVRFIY